MKDELVGLSDYVWQRTEGRLQGLGDEEYRWEPVPGSWTVRAREGGSFADGGPLAPDPPPFTTIAWRLAHLTRCYGEDRSGTFLGVALEPPVLAPDGSVPATSAAAAGLLARAHARWRAHLTAVPEEALARPLGPMAGPFAEGTLAGFALHMIDEFIHHGAEVGVLRDLYRATVAGSAVVTGDDLVDAAVRDGSLPAVASPEGHPHAVSAAAAAGRWDLVVTLAGLGFPLDPPSGRPSALHLAAGAGALDAVRALVGRGGDTAALDPDFGATPLGWAQYFGAAAIAAYLAER